MAISCRVVEQITQGRSQEMAGTSVALIVGGVVVACAALLWRNLKSRRKAAERAVSYRCVGIEPGDRFHACDAVKAVGSRRFLPGETPTLPLRACTADHCSCRYAHFDDRRVDNRRIGRSRPASMPLQLVGWVERRHGRGRRKADRQGGLDEAQIEAAIAEKRRRRSG